MSEHLHDISRRSFIGGLGASAAGLLLSGCTAQLEETSSSSFSETEAQNELASPTSTDDPPKSEAATSQTSTPASEFASKISELEDNQTFTFLWISDLHFRASDTEQYAKVPEYLDSVYSLAEEMNASALLITGDLVDGREDLEVHYTAANTITEKLRSCPIPVLPVRGNHDDNSYYTENITTNNVPGEVTDTNWIAENLIGPVLDDACVGNPNQGGGATYYYRDFEDSKIRVIVLDDNNVPYTTDEQGKLIYKSLMEFGIDALQLEWLANEALQFDDDGWGVIVATHVNLDDDQIYGLRGWGQKQTVHNDQVACALLSAYANRESGTVTNTNADFALDLTYDFIDNRSSELICCMNGHTHRDQCRFNNGLLSLTMKGFTEGGPARIDAVVVDRAKKLVRTRAYDTVSGDSVDWDLSYVTGSGIPSRFNYYEQGKYIIDDGAAIE